MNRRRPDWLEQKIRLAQERRADRESPPTVSFREAQRRNQERLRREREAEKGGGTDT